MLLSFIIPCYGSENTIEAVTEELLNVLKQREVYDYEIIAVNDCSRDNVWDKLVNLANRNSKFKVINLAKNFGKHGALMAGFKFASGDYIICLDDDGQCPVDRLWELIAPLDEGYDISIAKYPKKKQSGLKNFGSKVNNLMTRVALKKPKDWVFSNFIARKSFVCKEIIKYNNPYPYLEGLTLSVSNNIAFVEMEERERASGVSGYTLKKSLKLWLNGLTAFSVVPLRISSLIGVLTAFAGFIFGIITILRKLIVHNISVGWSSTVSIILFIGGMIMLMLGLIGEYIGRIYISINNSPQYVIKETINIKDHE